MEITNNKPTLLVKHRNMQLVVDYCIENKLKFNVTPRVNNDEWEFELNLNDIMSAVALGIFIRENKIDMVGLNYAAPKAVVSAPVAKAVKATKNTLKRGDLMEEDTTNNQLLDIESGEDSNSIVTAQAKTELAF